jgi:anaerobic sulfite reductase subunit B
MATALAEPLRHALTPAPFRVTARSRDTADTWTLELEPLTGEGPAIAPGQFVMVYRFGVGEVPISVSGASGVPGPVVLTIRDVGAVTKAVCASEPGAVLGLRGPFGNAWPVGDAADGDVIVVAGGIGLAPLRPVILHVLGRRADYDDVTLLYGARTPADLLYTGELERWRGDVAVGVTVDSAGDGWNGHVGVVTKLLAGVDVGPDRTTAFVCGPEIMMRFAVEALLARGLAPERIHLSMERDMHCGVGLCGHCQLGPTLICRDGPVYTYAELAPWMEVRRL